MTSLSENRALRLSTLSALYFAQGLPWGFISVGYTVMLADLGYGATEIGAAMGLAYLPWSFKILWGPMLDAVPPLRIGRRRPFIIVAEILMGLTLIGLMLTDPKESMATVSLLLFLHNTFAALQDVAVDAMAVDILEEDERGSANALMWAGKSLGVVFGGGGGTLVASAYGWNTLFVGMAIVLWLIMLLPILLPERPPAPTDEALSPELLRLSWFLLPFAGVGAIMYGLSSLEAQLEGHPAQALVAVAQPFCAVAGAIAAWPLVDREGFDKMKASFSFATPWWGVLAAVFAPAGYALVGPAMSKLIRVDLGLSSEQIALLSGTVDPVAGVVGALMGGLIADRLGVKRGIALCMVGLTAMLLAWAGTEASWSSFTWLLIWTAVFQALLNAFSAATLGLYMSLSNPRIGATHFAVYMAATNLTYAWTAPVGGLIADNFGFTTLFTVAAALQLVMIALLVPIDISAARRAYGEAIRPAEVDDLAPLA